MTVPVNFNPTSDVELNIFTTEPGWQENINTDIRQLVVGRDGKPVLDKEGNEQFVSSFWHTLKFLKRDFRLGFLNPKFDDYDWLENRLQLAQNLLSLRAGGFHSLAPMALMPVIGKIEISQSRNALLRREFRTFRFDSKEDKTEGDKGGLFAKFFR